ncbi:hypothetical protein [Fibrella aestuarina]|uniref:hypothetical protein n=1 Tax=Fibrella aestuarina TaxID=651143 RepID=UPI00059DC097|nr:hypothetical protein [Fibrella aestuarina]
MKALFLMVVILVGSQYVMAQKVNVVTQTVDGRLYTATPIANSSTIEFANSNNKLKNVKSTMPQEMKETYLNYLNFGDTEKSHIQKVVQEAVSGNKKLPKGERLDIKYYISPSGTIRELSFLIKNNSAFSPADLKKIEDKLKSDYHFRMSRALPADINYISFIMPTSIAE